MMVKTDARKAQLGTEYISLYPPTQAVEIFM